MNKRVSIIAAMATLALVINLAGQGCQGPEGTSTGNPVVSIRFSEFSSSSSSKVFQGPGNSTVQSITMCIKRLRFKPVPTSDTNSKNIDLNLGEITLHPDGTEVTAVQLPEGIFRRIEFDLHDKCASNESLKVVNANGSFATGDNITIRFEGVFENQGDATLELMIQQIASALESVSNNSQIRNAAESVTGAF